MKMWCVNIIILLLFCDACLSTGNGTVYFVSKNFYNVLHWNPVIPASPGEKVLYSVQYWSDVDERYQIKDECQNITALTCDLTAETPSVPDVHYQALVSVNGHSHGRTMNRLKPIADTILGPPTLSTYTTVSSLYVNVTLPLGPNGVSVADIIRSSKNGPSETVIVYTLKITEPKWAALVNESRTGQFVINLKNNHTEYCGYVVYRPQASWGRVWSENAPFCIMLPDDPWMLLPWVFSGAALLVAIVVISVVSTCKYVKGGKQNKPESLVLPSGNLCKVLQPPDHNITFSKPVINVESDQTVYATILVKPNVPSVRCAGYAPQDIPCEAWQDTTGSSVDTGAHGSTPNIQDTSAQSYSAVAVHVPAEVNKDFQQANTEDRETHNLPLTSSEKHWDKVATSPEWISCRVPPFSDLDSCESNPARPLLLHAVRDPNGQLVLPSLALQLQKSSTGDTLTPLGLERKPLLSDLIDCKREGPSLASLQSFDSSEWSDSGCDDSTVNTPTQPYCNTHYFPSQLVVPDFYRRCQNTSSGDAISESGYKQNWMPEILSRTASKDTCEYRRTHYPWTWTGPKEEEGDEEEEEGERDEDRGGGEERSRQILLGGWMVKIQE